MHSVSMKRCITLYCGIFILVGLLVTPAFAQEEQILVCIDGFGCEWTDAPEDFTADDLEVLVGEERPSDDAYVVCDTSGTGCEWLTNDPDDLDSIYSGDGVASTFAEDGSESGDSTTTVLVCIEGLGCRYFDLPPDVTEADLDEFFDLDPAPSGDAYVVCDDVAGCRWTTNDEELLDELYGGDGDTGSFTPAPRDAESAPYEVNEEGDYIPLSGEWLFDHDYTGVSAGCPAGTADFLPDMASLGIEGISEPVTFTFGSDFTMPDLFTGSADGMTVEYGAPFDNVLIVTLYIDGDPMVTYEYFLINPGAMFVNITLSIPESCVITMTTFGIHQG